MTSDGQGRPGGATSLADASPPISDRTSAAWRRAKTYWNEREGSRDTIPGFVDKVSRPYSMANFVADIRQGQRSGTGKPESSKRWGLAAIYLLGVAALVLLIQWSKE